MTSKTVFFCNVGNQFFLKKRQALFLPGFSGFLPRFKDFAWIFDKSKLLGSLPTPPL